MYIKVSLLVTQALIVQSLPDGFKTGYRKSVVPGGILKIAIVSVMLK